MKLFNWLSGFLGNDKNTSSKRLVGISGAFTLFYTLTKNPIEGLVWATFALSAVSLGLTTIEAITELISKYKSK